MGRPFAAVINLGCRVNRVESDRISADLVQAGFNLVDPDEADLIVINTCAVTGEAEAKTRKAVRHALGRERAPLVLATGCAANLHPEMLTELSPRVTVEPQKTDVAACARELIGGGAVAEDPEAPRALDADELARVIGRARAGVKIQDGCNNRCTYCIVWKARGPERSVPVDAVIDQVRRIAAAGIPEAVLTGVNLGAYDGVSAEDRHVEIDELLGIILRETAIGRVRLSSIEPMDVSDRLIERMAADPVRVAPFLHLPLQSGCTQTLERMGRPYTADGFAALAARIREALPQVALSCDVIVGFPGETDAEFARSLAFCEEMGFARMHVFRYSPRPGTIAAEAPDQVPAPVKEERSRQMRALAARLAHADAARRVGTVERAVIEAGNRGTLGSFHRVRVTGLPEGGEAAAPALVDVELTGVDGDGALVGRAMGAAAPFDEEAR